LLQALEAENFGLLPGGIFTRSFIRAYARYLGLDEEQVLAEYQLVAQPKADFDITRLTASRPTPAHAGSRGPLLALFLAVLLIGGGYAVFRYSHRTAETEGGARPPAQTAPAPQPAAGPATATTSSLRGGDQAAASQSGVAPAVPTVATDSSPSAPSTSKESLPEAEGGLVLQVAATEPSWVAIEADGKAALQRVLSPSEIQTIRARTSFDVTTGNALGIILTLNGETLKPLGRRGEVKSIHLTHDDVKKSTP
jgi:cytoskeletal protein RodZ